MDLAACIANEKAAPVEMAEFAHLDATQRTRLAAAVRFPAEWHAKVELDATGMAKEITLDLPATGNLAPTLLEIVRQHPCLFGVLDPARLAAEAYLGRDVFFTHEPHTIGALHAKILTSGSRTAVTFEGHFWPIADVKFAADVPARYLDKPATFDKEMFGVRMKDGSYTRPGHIVSKRNTVALDFRVTPQPVIACEEKRFVVVAALYVELRGTADGAPLAELPAPIDPKTGKPVTGAWIAPVIVLPEEHYAPDDRLGPSSGACTR